MEAGAHLGDKLVDGISHLADKVQHWKDSRSADSTGAASNSNLSGTVPVGVSEYSDVATQTNTTAENRV